MVEQWTLDGTPHVSCIAPTGGGKSFLMYRGLMPSLKDEQVMVIDVKGWDDEINGAIARDELHKVKKFPGRLKRRYDDPPNHYVYLARDNVDTAHIMEACYNEGDWTLFLDEERAVTDRHPSLGLSALVEKYRLRGRGRMTVVAGTQAPRFVVSSFYDQASHLYLARLEDKRSRRRLQEIGGNSEIIDQTVARLKRYEFLYVGPLTEHGSRLMEVIKVGHG